MQKDETENVSFFEECNDKVDDDTAPHFDNGKDVGEGFKDPNREKDKEIETFNRTLKLKHNKAQIAAQMEEDEKEFGLGMITDIVEWDGNQIFDCRDEGNNNDDSFSYLDDITDEDLCDMQGMSAAIMVEEEKNEENKKSEDTL